MRHYLNAFRASQFFPFARCLRPGILALLLIAGTLSVSAKPTSQRHSPAVAVLDNQGLSVMRDAYLRQDLKTLEHMRKQFEGHVLESYPAYWWLSANLGSSASFALTHSVEIRAFFENYPDSPLAEQLRREWVKILGKKKLWNSFAPEAAKVVTDDSELTCLQWQYRLTQHDREALSEAKALWGEAKPAPETCYDVFDILAKEKRLSNGDVWMRVRSLLENGQLADARRSAPYAFDHVSKFEAGTARINLDAKKYLHSISLQFNSRTSIELVLYALSRVARSDAPMAAGWLEKNSKSLPPPDAKYAWAIVATSGAMQHEDSALSWFRKAGSGVLSDTQMGWKVRAALRAKDWPSVQQTIEAMSAAERRDVAWRYWLARALMVRGDKAAATPILESLARENHFYGVLAAEEIGLSRTTDWQEWKPAARDIESVAARPAIKRALALYRLDMKAEALREWQYAIRDMDDKALLAAAEAAREANVPDRAINTAERTLMLHDFTQRYPLPHRDDLKNSINTFSLDEAWVYGLIRQESRFMADAKSRAGALGLMQLMPETAKWAARQVGMKDFALARVVDVSVNLNLGTFYLRHVLDDLGHPVLATAAYNAGPGRARRWRAAQPLEGAIYAETIPFNETRDYVKKVMTNAWFYTQRLGYGVPSLKNMIGTAPGRYTANTLAAAE